MEPLALQVMETSEMSYQKQVGKNLKEGADQAAKVNKTRATTRLQSAHSRLEANKEEKEEAQDHQLVSAGCETGFLKL